MLISFSHEPLKRLAAKTGETSHLAVREGKQTFFLDHCASPHQIIVISGQTAEFLPLHSNAHGKALLADCGVPELKAIFGSKPLQAFTSRTASTIVQLARACAKIRTDGYAVDDQEYVEGVRCIAAPVRDKDGVVIASIGISAPLKRLPRERCPIAARDVCEAAQEIDSILSAEPQE